MFLFPLSSVYPKNAQIETIVSHLLIEINKNAKKYKSMENVVDVLNFGHYLEY